MASNPAEGDWPQTPSGDADGWASVRARLDAAQSALLVSLRRFPEDRLEAMVGTDRDAPLGSGVTHRAMLHGLAQHNAYHGGQMAYVKHALRATPRVKGLA
jgi:hypothetical protein